jgi:hypothetical protein
MGLIRMGTNGNVDHRVDFQPTEKLMIGQKPERLPVGIRSKGNWKIKLLTVSLTSSAQTNV